MKRNVYQQLELFAARVSKKIFFSRDTQSCQEEKILRSIIIIYFDWWYRQEGAEEPGKRARCSTWGLKRKI